MNWFNWSAPWVSRVRLWNLFRRHIAGGDKASGIGVLQVGGRHLLYAGRVEVDGAVRYPIAVGFVWLTGRP